MGLRDRREKRHEERETFGRGGNARRYQLREKMFSIGDDFWIEDENGARVYRVDGKVLRLRKTFHLEDLEGQRVCTIQSPSRMRTCSNCMRLPSPSSTQGMSSAPR